ncbi:MAG: methyl-accepting chemotaxis protein [Burkholderiales bacterium]|nr:methyl-accepting chemotaxis protein [Burkholderiales bacterium]
MNFLNQIKVSYRFLLVGCMSLLLAALPTYSFLQNELPALTRTEAEQRGVQPLRDMIDVIRYMQQHRGLSSMRLAGNAQAVDKLKTVAGSLADSQAKIEAHLKSQALPATLEQWGKLNQRWAALSTKLNASGTTRADSFAEHTAVIADAFKVFSSILNDSKLILDSQPENYYLIVAANEVLNLSEAQGQLRAVGSGILSAQVMSTDDELKVGVLLAQSQQAQTRAQSSFEYSFAADDALSVRLKDQVLSAQAASQKVMALVHDNLSSASPLTYPAAAYFQATTESIDQQLALADASLALIEELLDQRLKSDWGGLLLVLACMLATMIVGTAISLLGGRSVTRQLGGEPGDVTRWVGTIAQGDLSSTLDTRTAVEGSIVHALSVMQANLRQMVLQVRGSASQVVDAAGQIAAGNGDLSGRTERQASALEEISASMEELLATVRQNADNARQANGLASSASDVASRGGAQMAEVVETMQAINSSANKIGDIIGVIDGIAFQTNILALNAAVEAARAGEQGRGFAVVATEVRSLAQRSAVAAKEIKSLIADSISKVEQGSLQVGRTGDTMHEMVTSVKRVTDIMGEVSASSVEQTAGIEQVNSAIVQMDGVTQQNAALVEQAAAASDSLRDQAAQLRELVSSFKVGQESSFAPVQAMAYQTHVPPARQPLASAKAASAKPAAAKPKATALAKPATATKPAAAAKPAPSTPRSAPAATSPRQPAPASKPEPELKRPALGKFSAPAAAPVVDKGAKAAPAPLSDDDWEEF